MSWVFTLGPTNPRRLLSTMFYRWQKRHQAFWKAATALALFNYWATAAAWIRQGGLSLSSSLPLFLIYCLLRAASLSLSAAIACCGSNWASLPLLLLAASHIAAAHLLLNIACCRLLTLSVSLHEYCLLQIAAHWPWFQMRVMDIKTNLRDGIWECYLVLSISVI
jgi:hypothetical protein